MLYRDVANREWLWRRNASTLDRSKAIVVPDYQYSAHVASEDLLLWLIDNLGFVFVWTS